MIRTLVTRGTLGLTLVAAGAAQAVAGGYTVVHAFQGASNGDGSLPFASLVRDSSGNFYGTTNQGGTSNLGTVFKVTSKGVETVLHSFAGGSDGSGPRGGLVADKKGNLYGMTYAGGSDEGGTVFEILAGGSETVLRTFSGGADGSLPGDAPIRDGSGNLYGTASSGGNDGSGTVFKLAPNGTLTVVYTFTGGADGGTPEGKLMMDRSGDLYGTTFFGGASGQGVVFKLDTSGNETALYSFQGGSDGAGPYAGVIQDKAGNLYGTTELGGNMGCFDQGCGTLFKIDAGGAETVLYTFKGGSDGGDSRSDLVEQKGSFYGTTMYAGDQTCLCGTIFKVTSSGTETTLHAFTGANDVSMPWGGLLKVKKELYGTASEGGDAQSQGVVFKLKQ